MQCGALKRRVKLPTKNKKRFLLKWPMSGKDLPSKPQTFRAEAEPSIKFDARPRRLGASFLNDRFRGHKEISEGGPDIADVAAMAL